MHRVSVSATLTSVMECTIVKIRQMSEDVITVRSAMKESSNVTYPGSVSVRSRDVMATQTVVKTKIRSITTSHISYYIQL